MPYDLVSAIRANVALNWKALPPTWQYAITTAAAAASVPIYEEVTQPHPDWHRMLSSAIRMALVALICHRLPKPQGPQGKA